MPSPVIIRKSVNSYFLSLITAAICLFAVFYTFSHTDNRITSIAAAIVLLPFSYFTIRKSIRREIQIRLTDDGITFSETNFIKWSEIKNVYLDTRKLDITVKGGRTKLTYLNIEPIFSGQFSKQRVVRSFVISDMEIPPAIILHHIRSFLQRHNLPKLTFAATNHLPHERQI